jgi:hypothetical protein
LSVMETGPPGTPSAALPSLTDWSTSFPSTDSPMRKGLAADPSMAISAKPAAAACWE